MSIYISSSRRIEATLIGQAIDEYMKLFRTQEYETFYNDADRKKLTTYSYIDKLTNTILAQDDNFILLVSRIRKDFDLFDSLLEQYPKNHKYYLAVVILREIIDMLNQYLSYSNQCKIKDISVRSEAGLSCEEEAWLRKNTTY